MNLKSPVDRFRNDQAYETERIFSKISPSLKMSDAMMLIAQCSLFFAALQFVVITRYYASLRLANNKQQCTLSTIQLRILG